MLPTSLTMHTSQPEVGVGPALKNRIELIRRFWIGTLLMQLGLIAMCVAAIPKYDTGEPVLSVPRLLTGVMIVALAFYGVSLWERRRLRRIPVELTDATADGAPGPASAYAFAQPRDNLLRAVTGSVPTALLRLVLVLVISAAALIARNRGGSLPFSLALIGVSLFIQWRIFPTIEDVKTKLERSKGASIPPEVNYADRTVNLTPRA